MAMCQTLALTDARYHSGNRAELVPLRGHIMPCMGPLADERDDRTQIVTGGSEEVVGEVGAYLLVLLSRRKWVIYSGFMRTITRRRRPLRLGKTSITTANRAAQR